MRRWLFTVCKNVFLRTNERIRDTVPLDDDAGNETLAAVRLHNELVASGEDGLLDRIDVRPAIARALATLPPAYRLAIVLVDLEGHDYAGAAALLEIPIGTVRSRLFRARRLLQEVLRAHAHDAGIGRSVPLPGKCARMTNPTTAPLAPFDCLDTVRRLWDYLDEELSAEETQAIDAHLALCDRCPPHFAFEHAFLGAVRTARAERQASEPLRARVRALLGLGGLGGLDGPGASSAATT